MDIDIETLAQRERIAYIEGRTAEAALLGALEDALEDAPRRDNFERHYCPECGCDLDDA